MRGFGKRIASDVTTAIITIAPLPEVQPVHSQKSVPRMQFLNDERYKSDVNVKTKIVDLYIEYKYYCQENGFYHLTKPNFIKRLKSYGIQVSTINVGNVAYLKKHKSDEE